MFPPISNILAFNSLLGICSRLYYKIVFNLFDNSILCVSESFGQDLAIFITTATI